MIRWWRVVIGVRCLQSLMVYLIFRPSTYQHMIINIQTIMMKVNMHLRIRISMHQRCMGSSGTKVGRVVALEEPASLGFGFLLALLFLFHFLFPLLLQFVLWTPYDSTLMMYFHVLAAVALIIDMCHEPPK